VSFTTTVAVNTSLADLDDSLSALLRRELQATGFDSIAVAFDTPNREWAATVSQPTINLFLYELRENRTRRQAQWGAGNGGAERRTEVRPPVWLDACYTLTAFSRAVEDEHRLLSQAISTLAAFPELPQNVLQSTTLSALHQEFGPFKSRLGDPRQDAVPDFWASIGGPYKLSLNYIVTLPFPSGAVLQRGRPVSTRQLNVADRSAPRGGLEEHLTVGGIVVDLDGQPVPGAWAFLQELGRACATDASGRFSFNHVKPGTYVVDVRAADGREGHDSIAVQALR
jgi:hypothetical protein